MSSIDNCYMGHEGLLDGLSKQSSVECTWVTEVGHEEEHSLTVAKCNVPIRSYSTPKKSCFICWGYISSVYLCGCLVTLEVGAKKKAHIHIHPPSVIVLSQFSLVASLADAKVAWILTDSCPMFHPNPIADFQKSRSKKNSPIWNSKSENPDLYPK